MMPYLGNLSHVMRSPATYLQPGSFTRLLDLRLPGWTSDCQAEPYAARLALMLATPGKTGLKICRDGCIGLQSRN